MRCDDGLRWKCNAVCRGKNPKVAQRRSIKFNHGVSAQLIWMERRHEKSSRIRTSGPDVARRIATHEEAPVDLNLEIKRCRSTVSYDSLKKSC